MKSNKIMAKINTFLVMDFIGEDEADNAERRKSRSHSKSRVDCGNYRRGTASSFASTCSSSAPDSSDAKKTIKEIVFLYRVIEGSHQYSHALQIAKSMDLGDGIVDRAVEVLGAMTDGRPLAPIVTAERKRRQDRNKRLLEEVMRREDITERDVEELRKWVREWDVSGSHSVSGPSGL